ncbi:MAG TPA: DUF4287 domain-containing protein [Candidatus Thermoplasmatota archaeon]|nr:DUF4287 domain-containing protein [Candidatus Thermoplasmatota archaeon]
MVRAESWDVEDEQVIAKTGKPLAHWMRTLKAFKAATKTSAETVAFLQEKHGVPRSWARTLTTHFLKSHA